MTGSLREQLADYLTLRRALGYRLVRTEKLLSQFLGHLEDRGQSAVSVASALDWARLPAGATSNLISLRNAVAVSGGGWRSRPPLFSLNENEGSGGCLPRRILRKASVVRLTSKRSYS